jgi:hypothetical protein
MCVLPLLWFVVWYVAWFDHSDCLGALRQIGDRDPALSQVTIGECKSAATNRRLIEIYGLAAVVLLELGLWMTARRKP